MKIRERVLGKREDGSTIYAYFVRRGRQWVDLAPYGNRIPVEWEASR